MKSVDILGVKVNDLTAQEALEEAKKLIDVGGKHFIVTPNPEIVMTARKEKQFREILNKADFSIPDGAGLVIFSPLFGHKLRSRVTGVDLLQGLASMGEEFGYRLFLLGAGEGVAAKAAERLKEAFPKLNIVGTYSGSPDNKNTVSQLKNKEIDILAVAFGAGKQEKWIYENLPKINVKLAIGVGGALDFISGEKQRAPKWVQNIGLEWLHRLAFEPTRIKRQLSLPAFAYHSIKQIFSKKMD